MPDIQFFGTAPPTARHAKLNGGEWYVPEEIPVAFIYNRRNYAVMLATPTDMADFAIGFSLTERVIDQVNDISAIDIHQSARGIELHLSIEPEKLNRLDIRQQRRNLVGRAGCGVCGLENAETFFEPLPQVSRQPISVDKHALQRAAAALPGHQRLNAETRTVHAAAWVSHRGEIICVREDVGRHNALDKLLGALARDGFSCDGGFVLMSSRCSYEIIEKSARMGVQAVASISAPTAFALRKAVEAKMTLYARDGDQFVQVGAEGPAAK